LNIIFSKNTQFLNFADEISKTFTVDIPRDLCSQLIPEAEVVIVTVD